jgi:hypothetical protein
VIASRKPSTDAIRIGRYEKALNASMKYFTLRITVQRDRPSARAALV